MSEAMNKEDLKDFEITANPNELEDYLANAISDSTGFCVEHFIFKKQK